MNDKQEPKRSSWTSKKPTPLPEDGPDSRSDAPVEGGKVVAFSTVNAVRRQSQAMLELRHKNGYSLGLSYAYLTAAMFDPSSGITLEMGGYKVILQGVNLRRLYRRILTHGVGIIREVDSLEGQDGEEDSNATAVYRIQADKV